MSSLGQALAHGCLAWSKSPVALWSTCQLPEESPSAPTERVVRIQEYHGDDNFRLFSYGGRLRDPDSDVEGVGVKI